ncbi:hypothetical protein WJX79_007807 [Trebouxia sp. C0005]
MEVLLTPVVNKLLKRFIKSAEGRSGSSLRVALSGDSVVLHNLELNLEPLLHNLPTTVERAFARQLKLVIPWTSLATQPIQVLLDTVEVVLSLSDKQSGSGVDRLGGADKVSASRGWMGSFTCLTATDAWRLGLPHANDWLKKQLELENMTVSIQAQHIASDNATEATPLLILKSLRIAALAPVFAVLADRSVVGQTTAVVDIDLHPLICCISRQQVAWLTIFAQAIPTVLAARASMQPSPQQQPSESSQTPARKSSVVGSAVSLFGQAWMYITDEAAAVAAEGPDGLDKAAQHHTPMPKPHLHFNVTSQGGSVTCTNSTLLSASSAPTPASSDGVTGQIRAKGRPGSLVAGLLSMQKPPLPQHGLRVSAVGVQLGMIPLWSGITDVSKLWPAGIQEVTEPIEMQALLQGFEVQVGSAADEEPEAQPPDLAFWMTSPSFSYSKSTAQAPGAQCNDQGFYQLPTTNKALVLSLPNFILATAAVSSHTVAEGAAAETEGLQWVCRVAPSKEEDQFQADPSALHDSLLSLQYTKVERPNEDDNMDVVLMTQALHMQILPSFVQAAVGLATCCTHALKANKAPDPAPSAASTVTAKATIQGLHLGLLSGTGQRAQFQADDMILIVHNALGAEAQRLGPQGLQLTTMDLTLAAAKLTVMGTGLPAFGLMPSFTDSVSGMSALSGEEQQHLNEGRAPPSQSSTDDLRCGLFSMTPMLASRPGPMQVSVGEEGPGYMPWNGSRESWVGWCYPYPRPVQVLCIQRGMALLGRAEVEVCCYVADVDEYTPLACTVHSDAITQDLLIFVAETRPTLEWQLVCHSPSKEGPCNAKTLLRHLLVNPPSLTTDLPPLQSVPLTVTVQVRDIRVHLLVETVEANHNDTASEELGHTLGMIYLTSLQAVLHKCEKYLSLPRSLPAAPGLRVHLRSGNGPLVLRVGQLSLDALRRSVALVSQSIRHYLLPSAKPLSPQIPHLPGSPSSQTTPQPVTSAPQQQQCGILVRNMCPLDLSLGQLGTDEMLRGFRTGTPFALQPKSKEGQGGSCSVELVPLTAASGKGHLQVWLGSSQGWSLPVSLIHPNPQVVLLRPGGLGEGSPNRPQGSATAAHTSPGMWCQLCTPDPASGQVSIVIWPLYSIFSALPVPVYWRLTAATAQPGAYQSPMVTLCLVPLAVLHNSLPFPICLDVLSEERQLPVAAGSSQALDWSSLSYRPKSIALAMTEAQGNRLVSQPFALDTSHDMQLTFGGNASSTSPAAISHSITFYAAARVHNEPFEIRPGREGDGEALGLCIQGWDWQVNIKQEIWLRSTGGKGYTAGVKTHAEMTAEGLQMDSFCADSTHPVILHAVPTADAPTAAAKQSHGTGFAISLQVCEASPAPEGGAESGSFCNTWIQQLALHLPPLAVAIDDSFMALVERADPRSPVPSWTPSAKSPMSLLEQARQAKQLNDALDNFGAGRPIGTASSPWRNTPSPSQPGVRLLFDIHVADGGPNIPFALDTHRAPLSVAGVGASKLLFQPSVMLHGLLAHAVAEALLSAPGMLGSLDLLFNPTGLLQSLSQAWGDLLLGPLAAIEARSPSQFLVGLGAGGATFVRQLSAWTLGSIGGFSNASSRVLARALQTQPAARGGHERGGVVGQGLRGLVGGVAAGVTGVVRAPLQGYNDGTGLVAGVGRGLLGVVGLPLSGALGLVGAVSSGLASTAGLAPAPAVRRPAQSADDRPILSPVGIQRLISCAALARSDTASGFSG